MSTADLPLNPHLQYPSPVHTPALSSELRHHSSVTNDSPLNLSHSSPASTILPTPLTDSPPTAAFSDKPSFGLDARSSSLFVPVEQQPTWTAMEDADVEHIMVDGDAAAEQDEVMGEEEEQMRVDEEQAYEEGDGPYPTECEMQPVDEEVHVEVVEGTDDEVLETGDVEAGSEYARLSAEVKAFLQNETSDAQLQQSSEVLNGDYQEYEQVKEGIERHQDETYAQSDPVEPAEGSTASVEARSDAVNGVTSVAEGGDGFFREKTSNQGVEDEQTTNSVEVHNHHNDTQDYEETETEEPSAKPIQEYDDGDDGEQEGEESTHVHGEGDHEEGLYPDGDEGQYPYAGDEEEVDPNQEYHDEDESANSVEVQYDQETVQDEEPYVDYENEDGAYEHTDSHEAVEEGEGGFQLHYRAYEHGEADSHETAEDVQLVTQQRSGALPAFVLEYQQTFYCMFSPLPSVPESDVLFLGNEVEANEGWTVDHLCRELKNLFEIESDVVLEFTNLELSFYEGSQHTAARLDTLVQMHDALSASSGAEVHETSQPMKVLLLECRNSFERQWQSLSRLIEERPMSRKRMRRDEDGDEEENEEQAEEYRDAEDDVNGSTKRPRLEESSAREQEVQ
ncbi:hypothetical protein BJ742DRAFT_775128 [Cladochytrium replicatum]|nr:hypothetical protein BJ742DRAFT_775128 [Cladochytrium replicatum]